MFGTNITFAGNAVSILDQAASRVRIHTVTTFGTAHTIGRVAAAWDGTRLGLARDGAPVTNTQVTVILWIRETLTIAVRAAVVRTLITALTAAVRDGMLTTDWTARLHRGLHITIDTGTCCARLSTRELCAVLTDLVPMETVVTGGTTGCGINGSGVTTGERLTSLTLAHHVTLVTDTGLVTIAWVCKCPPHLVDQTLKVTVCNRKIHKFLTLTQHGACIPSSC